MRSASLLLFSTLCLASAAQAGQLDDYETSATHRRTEPRESPPPKEKSVGASLADDLVSDTLSGFFSNVFPVNLVDSVGMSLARVRGAPAGSEAAKRGVRVNGDPDLPFVDVDVNYQWVHSDVHALQGRGEVGYGPAGFEAVGTHYTEQRPRDSLNLFHLHGLLRLSDERAFQFNVGLGQVILDGNHTHSGFSTTLPISVYPWKHFGFRFIPTWGWIAGNQISEYDGSLEYVQKFSSLRFGYKTNRVGGQALKGLYVGVSYHY